MWNEKTIVQLDITSQRLSGGSEKISDHFSRHNLISGPKHEARVSTHHIQSAFLRLRRKNRDRTQD